MSSLDLTRKASGKLLPYVFDVPGQRHLAIIWGVTEEWYTRYKALIPKNFLFSECVTALTMDPELNSAPIYASLLRTLNFIKEFDVSMLSSSGVVRHITSGIQALIDTSVVIPEARGDWDNVTSSMGGLIKTFKRTRVSSSVEVNLNDTVEMTLGTKVSTLIPTIDLITNGGFSPGDVFGLVGGSGGGKTTLAIQLGIDYAQLQWQHVLYLPYESAIRPEYWRRFIGCACRIPSPIMNQFNNISEMSEELQAIVQTKWTEQTQPRFHVTEMLGDGTGVPGLESILADYESRGIHIDLVIVDQYFQLLKQWRAATGSRQTVKDDSQMMTMEIVRVAAEARTAVVLLHQKTAAEGQTSPAKRVEKGQAQEDKAFDNWLPYCVGLGNRGVDDCFWINKTKSRHVSAQVDGVLKLYGDNYRVEDVTHKMSGYHDGIEFKLKPNFKNKAVTGPSRREELAEEHRRASNGP